MIAPGEIISVGAERLHLLRRGSGSPVVVFEAGAGQLSSTWLPVLDALAGLTTACTWDRPGYGWSDRSRTPLGLDSVTDSLSGLLDAAGLAPPYVLVGWSLGAFYVRRFAQRRPAAVAGMVLVDPSHEAMLDPVPRPMLALMRAVRALQTAMPGVVARLARKQVRAEAARLFPALSEAERAELVALATRPDNLRIQFAEATRVVEQARRLPRTAGALGDIPLTVLAAGKMPGGERFRAHRLGRQLPELVALSTAGRLDLVADSGHSLPLERPALVADAVRQMVAELRGAEHDPAAASAGAVAGA